MKFSFKLLEKVKNQAGVSAVIVAIVLPMLIGFGALAIDVGYMCVTKNELQNVADAAALAATRKLGTIYQGMTDVEQGEYVCGDGDGDGDGDGVDDSDTNNDILVIKGVANAVAQNNKAGGEHIIVYDTTEGIEINEVEIGVWDPDNIPDPFTNYNQPDAVRVTAHRGGVANGPISTFFAKIFGIDTVDVSAVATAALTSQNISAPGELVLPIGISNLALKDCNDPIEFNPTKSACAGWTSFTEGANRVNIQKIITGEITSPELTFGDSVNFFGGENSTNTFEELLVLFKYMGHDINANGDPVATYVDSGAPVTGHLDEERLLELAADTNVNIDGEVLPLYYTDDEGNSTQLYYTVEPGPPYKDDLDSPRNIHLWSTAVLVYYEAPIDDETATCSNPNQSMIIDGFANILFTNVTGAPDHIVEGKLLCNQYSDNRGGGGDHGIKGTIPNLVE